MQKRLCSRRTDAEKAGQEARKERAKHGIALSGGEEIGAVGFQQIDVEEPRLLGLQKTDLE